MSMDSQKYNQIKGFVCKNLVRALHGRHLEDCIQHVAMEHWQGNTNWNWALANYCRQNGLNRKGKSKLSAITIEQSTFAGEDTWKLENNNSFATKEKESRFLGLMDEFLLQLNLTPEAYRWTMKIQARRLWRKEKIK